MLERHDTVVIGGGQAGLAMSYHLQHRGREHIIIERSRIAERWFSERWTSLRYQFPNWTLQLPGFGYRGDDPDAFASIREISRYIEDYAQFINAPIRCGVAAVSLRPASDGSGFIIDATGATLAASRVVIATGPFQRPNVPSCTSNFPAYILQLHASNYVAPEQLPPGAILVVGSGASGCQIAEELYQSGRTVYLCVCRHRIAPRRYRGLDLARWAVDLGIMDRRIDSFPGRKIPPSLVITGANGGHDIDLRRFVADGVVILGRLKSVDDGTLLLGDDGEDVLAAADKTFDDFKIAADEHVRAAGLHLPANDCTNAAPDRTPVKPIATLDLKGANITSVIWGTGYGFAFDWLKVPVLNESGSPIQERGVTPYPGLYFLGLHWMHTFSSGTVVGVGGDAAHLAQCMTELN